MDGSRIKGARQEAALLQIGAHQVDEVFGERWRYLVADAVREVKADVGFEYLAHEGVDAATDGGEEHELAAAVVAGEQGALESLELSAELVEALDLLKFFAFPVGHGGFSLSIPFLGIVYTYMGLPLKTNRHAFILPVSSGPESALAGRLLARRPRSAPTIPCLFAVLTLLLAPGRTQAQQITDEASLPSAPEPRLLAALQSTHADPAEFFPAFMQRSTDTPAIAAGKQSAPGSGAAVVTMAPHPEGSRWWVSGQANIIYQGRLPFHSLYQGPHSFHNSAEYKTSLVETLFMALRPTRSIRYNNDLVLDMESAGGRGLSQAFGLAGFTNLDVVRNPTLGPKPYLARYQVHQVIGLTERTTSQEPGPFALAPSVPLRRIEIRVGKLTLPDFFDVNGPGSDSHLQFMNWTVDNNGAWDYAADTRGYTVGGMAEYDDRIWSLRYGIFAMPTVANGIHMDWAFSRAHGQNGEFELRHSFIPGRKGTQRLLFYANNAHMGDYREAVEDFLSGADTLRYGVKVPTITLHEHFGALKYGTGFNFEQEITENLRVFGRFGWNEGQHESFAYTEVDQTAEAGADYAGARWHRPVDKVGLAVVTNAIKRDHQNYLHYGGLGFLLGDGNLNYGRETIVESYYNWHAWRGLFYAVDVQHIDNPGYNRDRGPAWVGSVRAHVDF